MGDDEFTGDLGRVAGEDVGFYNYTLGSLDAGANYELSLGGTAQFEITAKELTVTGATADDKPYDGGTDATISGASLVGVVGLDDVELDALVGTFAQANVGTDIAVTAALTLKGADVGNYYLTQPTGLMADIYKADQTITFEGGAWQSKTYGDAPFEITATASSGLTVEFDSSDETVATVNSPVTIVGAGTTTITASQPGDENWNEAIIVQHDLDVDPLAMTVYPLAGEGFEGDPDPTPFTYELSSLGWFRHVAGSRVA